MRRLRRWYIPVCRGQRGPAGSASPQAGAGLQAGARRGRRRPAARIAAAVYVSPELYSLPVSQEFASLRPPLGGRTRLVIINTYICNQVTWHQFECFIARSATVTVTGPFSLSMIQDHLRVTPCCHNFDPCVCVSWAISL